MHTCTSNHSDQLQATIKFKYFAYHADAPMKNHALASLSHVASSGWMGMVTADQSSCSSSLSTDTKGSAGGFQGALM